MDVVFWSFFAAKKRALKGVFIRLFAWYVPLINRSPLTGLNLLQIVPPLHSQRWLCRNFLAFNWVAPCFKPSLENVEGRAFWFWAPLNSIDPLSTRCCACNKMQRTLATSGVSSIQKKRWLSGMMCFLWVSTMVVSQNRTPTYGVLPALIISGSVMGTIWWGLKRAGHHSSTSKDPKQFSWSVWRSVFFAHQRGFKDDMFYINLVEFCWYFLLALNTTAW